MVERKMVMKLAQDRKRIVKRVAWVKGKRYKVGVIVFIIMLCMGCHNGALGSIQEETLDLPKLSLMIDDKIADGEWHMEVLQEPLEASMAEVIYGVDTHLYQEVLIRRSLIDLTCEEIVLFHAYSGRQTEIAARLREYQKERMTQYENLPLQYAQVEEAQVVEMGNYVLLVCSKDYANVVQYISSLE